MHILLHHCFTYMPLRHHLFIVYAPAPLFVSSALVPLGPRLHHRYFECNYGSELVPFDHMFGTYRKDL